MFDREEKQAKLLLSVNEVGAKLILDAFMCSVVVTNSQIPFPQEATNIVSAIFVYYPILRDEYPLLKALIDT